MDQEVKYFFVDFDFCLSTSTHFWTTSTDEVAWPQGDTFLGGVLVTHGARADCGSARGPRRVR